MNRFELNALDIAAVITKKRTTNKMDDWVKFFKKTTTNKQKKASLIYPQKRFILSAVQSNPQTLLIYNNELFFIYLLFLSPNVKMLSLTTLLNGMVVVDVMFS